MADPVSVSIDCTDIDAALAWYTGEGGLSVDTVFPADAPRQVALSGSGLRLTLTADGRAPVPVSAPALVVTRAEDQAFGSGRAGMQYRDLVPGRFGGRYIASHIRIEQGGPVPDYVHHHQIDFQMICCVNGWVRVVYEDQGAPMLLEAGDCFLQPLHIRHQVLECSDKMEVIEIASPAEHETSVDHAMRLPTERVDPDRDFNGQRFVFHRSSDANWLTSEVPGIEYRNTGIATATAGLASVVALRSIGGASDIPLRHSGEFHFVYLTAGSASLNDELLGKGDAVAVPAGIECTLRGPSDDFECLEVLVLTR